LFFLKSLATTTQVLLLNLSPRATKSVLIPELKRMSACSLGGYLQKTRQRLLRRGGQEEVKDSGKFYLFVEKQPKDTTVNGFLR
jgi:hypothetical protein